MIASSFLLFLTLLHKFYTMDFLKTLHIQKDNDGVSTGNKWLKSKGVKINSISPVNGKLIGTVTSADKKSYEKLLKLRKKRLLNGD